MSNDDANNILFRRETIQKVQYLLLFRETGFIIKSVRIWRDKYETSELPFSHNSPVCPGRSNGPRENFKFFDFQKNLELFPTRIL